MKGQVANLAFLIVSPMQSLETLNGLAYNSDRFQQTQGDVPDTEVAPREQAEGPSLGVAKLLEPHLIG